MPSTVGNQFQCDICNWWVYARDRATCPGRRVHCAFCIKACADCRKAAG
jgi:hypothetical protein